MLWKILSGISALCLAGGLYYSYESQRSLQAERKLADNAKQNLVAIQQTQGNATGGREKYTKQLEEATKSRDELKTQVETLTADVSDKTKEAEVVNLNLTEIKKQVGELEEQIKKHGDIQKLLAEVKLLTEEKSASESAVANKQQQMAIADERVVEVQKRLTALRESEANSNRGVIESSFTARVSQAFPGFGFVILNKGNRGGLIANASLEVKRGGSVVAKLKVRDVEQSVAVADIIPGSMSQENVVRAGDLVAASRQQVPVTPPVVSTPPADGAAAPVDPAAPATPGMAADPFAPTSADPFAPAPAAGAPAPASTDPFAPAPTTPAPAAPPTDPFAPPPAGATPAPAAPADPFAPAPAM